MEENNWTIDVPTQWQLPHEPETYRVTITLLGQNGTTVRHDSTLPKESIPWPVRLSNMPVAHEHPYTYPAPRGTGPATSSTVPASRDTGHGAVPPVSREEGPCHICKGASFMRAFCSRCGPKKKNGPYRVVRGGGWGDGDLFAVYFGDDYLVSFREEHHAKTHADIANTAYAAGRASVQGEAPPVEDDCSTWKSTPTPDLRAVLGAIDETIQAIETCISMGQGGAFSRHVVPCLKGLTLARRTLEAKP